jgi:hypothetical protein
MEKQKVIEWMLANLPDFPEYAGQFVAMPFYDWEWFCFGKNLFALSVTTGEYINAEEFYQARAESRLTPCGMSFSELLEDLKL